MADILFCYFFDSNRIFTTTSRSLTNSNNLCEAEYKMIREGRRNISKCCRVCI